tara:strand:- start:154 stop:459 length:306 start_codon:yes stop_codon:yes gene_type:complete
MIIEQDWALDYKIKQALPREMSPVWIERIDEAMRTKSHPDPIVERLARKAFDELRPLIRQGMAPRDARNQLVPPDSNDPLIRAIDIRLWQLQIRSIHGTNY